jgi:hypothetical protein
VVSLGFYGEMEKSKRGKTQLLGFFLYLNVYFDFWIRKASYSFVRKVIQFVLNKVDTPARKLCSYLKKMIGSTGVNMSTVFF